LKASGDIGAVRLDGRRRKLAKTHRRRQLILKKGLTPGARMAAARGAIWFGRTPPRGIVAADSSFRNIAVVMSLVSSLSNRPRGRRPARRGSRLPLVLGGALGAASIAAVAYLLWPTWHAQDVGDPDRTPVLIGDTLFNVPTKAFRVKYQRRSGPQDRVDLNFMYPSLAAPVGVTHKTAEEIAEFQPVDRIFVSIAAHQDTLAPDMRLRTIYPRYLARTAPQVDDGLTLRPFVDGSPYAHEDLFTAEQPPLAARCTRDRQTPGMCLSEIRIEGADLTFRFPRQWLTRWRDVAGAIGRLAAQLHVGS
jgi:hypothetical protein